jgi:hypothetical protein
MAGRGRRDGTRADDRRAEHTQREQHNESPRAETRESLTTRALLRSQLRAFVLFEFSERDRFEIDQLENCFIHTGSIGADQPRSSATPTSAISPPTMRYARNTGA